METATHSSRYVDYTTPTHHHRPPASLASSNDYPPARPPRRERQESPGSRSRDSTGPIHRYPREVYYQPGVSEEDDERAPSDRAESEFTVRNEAVLSPQWEEERRAASRAASEIYANARMARPARSEISHYAYRSGGGHSDVVSVKTKTTRGGKVVMETMTAPHPCCPNTKGVCCLMVLLNLGLLLITLGFVVVLQLYDPPFVWWIGLTMLIFGFMVLFGSMVYCVFVCREVEKLRPPPGELYWTNRWTKQLSFPEIHYTNTQYKPGDYRGSEFSFKTEPSRTTTAAATTSNPGDGTVRY